MQKNAWMVRAGGGEHFETFEQGFVGIGFSVHRDLTGYSFDQIAAAYRESHPGESKYKAAGAIGMLDRIVNTMQIGDGVITYDPGARIYLVGRIASDYEYAGNDAPMPHRRRTTWHERRVGRDSLKQSTKNTLGSTLTIFQLSPEVWEDLQLASQGKPPEPIEDTREAEAELEQNTASITEQARERLKDKVVSLDDRQMEELLAAVLRALGFQTRVSPTGPDRGVDVIASPDGLGLQEPRIKAEVKHRQGTQMGAPDIRGFIGALRSGDRGIYLSTGGFTREARYEAERANVPVTLLDLDDLARLIEMHYPKFDTEGRALLPLIPVYWPSE